MTHKILETERGAVHYWTEEQKGKPWIVWTHGLTADHTMFEKQTEYFNGKYSQLLWDVPLHGKSRPYENFSYANAAHDLYEIMDKENISDAVLVGMSMGGYPCQMFADLFPDKAAGFVALDTTPFGTKYYSKSDLMWLKAAAPLAKFFSDRLLRNSMARSVSKTEYSYQKMQDMLSGSSKKQIIEQMEIAYGVFARENNNIEFRCPVLLLLGDSDKTGKVSVYNQQWSQKTGFPLHVIPEAAHFSNGDNPQKVNMEIELFLKQVYSREELCAEMDDRKQVSTR